jgi:hypothetical protein
MDQICLPERAGAVHRFGREAGHLLGEDGIVAGSRQRELPDVEVQIDWAVDP